MYSLLFYAVIEHYVKFSTTKIVNKLYFKVAISYYLKRPHWPETTRLSNILLAITTMKKKCISVAVVAEGLAVCVCELKCSKRTQIHSLNMLLKNLCQFC